MHDADIHAGAGGGRLQPGHLRGSSEYLFENSRIDNIITDVYHDPFTSARHEVAKDFKLSVIELGYFAGLPVASCVDI